MILLFKPDLSVQFTWFTVGKQDFNVVLRNDPIAKTMCVLISFISLLVNIYSTAYMKGEKHYHKYFSYLGLFTFSMLGIVLFSNLLFVYAFWELVGLSSYLLIGFWYQSSQATMASKKAFIINRIGDIGFLAGILMLWSKYGHLELGHIHSLPIQYDMADTLIGICLFGGCVGKSAQFPLNVWLPDAMHGPTPASALIHAATMVAAGIYLMIRILPICTPETLIIVGLVGSFTAFMAALSACAQYDIKRILAFSTISQLGYMVVGISTGQAEVAYLHLFIHAFFKAGLFLCAGAIIHEIAHHHLQHQGKPIDPQDIRLMGGLSTKMKYTYVAYLLCYISAVGLPFSSGFISKDFIISTLLHNCYASQHIAHIITLLLTTLTILVTAFYMTRQLILVFWSEYRGAKEAPKFHETPLIMLVPVLILACFSFFFFFSINPLSASESYLLKYLDYKETIISESIHLIAPSVSVLLTLVGILWAYFRYRGARPMHSTAPLHALLLHNFYINRFYMRVIMPKSLALSKYIYKIDNKVIDNSFDKFAIANVITAHVLKVLDLYFVDGCYRLFKGLGTWFGGFGNNVQDSHIQNYLKISLLIALLTGIYFIIFI